MGILDDWGFMSIVFIANTDVWSKYSIVCDSEKYGSLDDWGFLSIVCRRWSKYSIVCDSEKNANIKVTVSLKGIAKGREFLPVESNTEREERKFMNYYLKRVRERLTQS